MNFATENDRDQAAKKLETVKEISTTSSKKLNPKITICNVNKEEEEWDFMKSLIERNDFLQQVENIENKIKLLFVKKAAGFRLENYIIKCDPEIRKVLHDHGDKVFGR